MEFKHKERECVLKALSNSTRRVILKQIVVRQGATYTELMALLGLDPDLESGGFNYHLKELAVAGLIERTNGFYRITDLGEKALVLIDQVSQDSKFDRYGVLYAAIAMNPRQELTLFIGQFGISFGSVALLYGVLLGVISSFGGGDNPFRGPLMMGVCSFLIVLGFFCVGCSLWILGTLVRRYNLGFSSLLLLKTEWFMIRSPNRGVFICLPIFGMLGIFLPMSGFILIYVGLVPLFSLLSLFLICATVLVWTLFFGLILSASRRAKKMEGMNSEWMAE
ncbi:MAG: winged helix-turn-helix domain-containing protein [Promethearchaeota archaeon]